MSQPIPQSKSLLPWIWGIAIAGGIATLLWYSALRVTFGPRLSFEHHAALGDSLAPIAALLSLGALLAALYAVELQRRELEENRAVLMEQSEQLKKSAEAQDALATATRELASAQREANNIAEKSLNAQQQLSFDQTNRASLSLRAQRIAAVATLQNGFAVGLSALMDSDRPSIDARNNARVELERLIKAMQSLSKVIAGDLDLDATLSPQKPASVENPEGSADAP